MAAVGPALTITKPDDFHLHVRDGPGMQAVVPLSSHVFRRAVIMPNLRPPVVNAKQAMEYKGRILQAVPDRVEFEPLMTLYLTDQTTPDDVQEAKEDGVVAFKLYPAGATTNSDSGVTDIVGRTAILQSMAEAGLPLLVHGEVTSPEVDMFDREAVFIDTVLGPLLDRVPDLKVVLEHITTEQAVNFVASAPPNVAATITPQHMLYNRNALFQGGLQPHSFCLPILKRERHRQAVLAAATSGSRKFFLGTDSAPHARGTKEAACGCAGIFSAPVALQLYAQMFENAGHLQHLEAFASHSGADFYGLPRNEGTIQLIKQPLEVPTLYAYHDTDVVPICAGKTLEWDLASS